MYIFGFYIILNFMKLPYDDQISLFNRNDRIRTCSSFAICVVSYTLDLEILTVP